MNTCKKIRARSFIVLILALLTGLGWGRNSSDLARANSLLTASQQIYLPSIQRSPGAEFTFISWSDTKSGREDLAALSNQAVRLKPAFTIYPGDLEPSGFDFSEITAWKEAVNGGVSNGMFDITLPLRGNHDGEYTHGWQDYFDIAGTAERVGVARFSTLDRNLTYSFDYQNARFIGIDVPGNAGLIAPDQIEYLDQMLAEAENSELTHAFIYFHGPIYAISAHTTCPTRVCDRDPQVVRLVEVLNKHKIVSAVFNSHEHVQAYIHIDSSRVPEVTHPFEEFITGSAGSPLYSCEKTYRFDYCGSYNGFSLVSVSGKSFTVSIYRLDKTSPVKAFMFTKP